MKVLVADDLSAEGVEILRRGQGLAVDVKVGLKPPELKAIIGEYDALDRGEAVSDGRPPQVASLERERLLSAQPRRDLDDRRARTAGGIGPLSLERPEQIAHEDSPPRSRLDEIP